MVSILRVSSYQYTVASKLHIRSHFCQYHLDCWWFTFFLANYQFKQFKYASFHCNVLNLCFNVINALGKLSEECMFIFSQKEQLHTQSGLTQHIGVWESPGFGDRWSGESNLDQKKYEKLLRRHPFYWCLLRWWREGQGYPLSI